MLTEEVYTAVAPLVEGLRARIAAQLQDNRRGERIREGCRMVCTACACCIERVSV